MKPVVIAQIQKCQEGLKKTADLNFLSSIGVGFPELPDEIFDT